MLKVASAGERLASLAEGRSAAGKESEASSESLVVGRSAAGGSGCAEVAGEDVGLVVSSLASLGGRPLVEKSRELARML